MKSATANFLSSIDQNMLKMAVPAHSYVIIEIVKLQHNRLQLWSSTLTRIDRGSIG